MVSALTFILPFKDKLAEKAEAKRKVNQEKENKFVEDNMLNFEVQMPLFAGLTWGDTFGNALEKVRKVNGIRELEAYCDFDRSFYDPMAEKLKAMQSMGRGNNKSQGEKSQTDRIKEALTGGDLSTITAEDAKVATEFIENCKISGKLILFNSEAELTVHIGKTSFGGQVPYYLNHISICGDFEANYDKLAVAYKAKYKDYNVKSIMASETRKSDKFGNEVDFGAACGGGKAVEYWKSDNISDLQNKQIADEINKQKNDQLKSQPQADSAL
jgi:hypothetical protein